MDYAIGPVKDIIVSTSTLSRLDPLASSWRQGTLATVVDGEGMLPVFQNLNYKLHGRISDVLPIYQSHQK